MALRAKKPEAVEKRLKLFMFGPAGVGKTTAAIQFPNAYIIDTEKGSENYDKLINGSGSAVLQTNDMEEIIHEVKQLLTEQHDYRTLVIDPITTAYNDLLEKCELKVGSEFGRHYGEANKKMKRLANLIMALDMNVVITAHAKKEYGDNLKVLGMTFDGWKQLDYWFDLVIELTKKSKKRFGRVVKTRISEAFPDEEVFEWSYPAIRDRYGANLLERNAQVLELATQEQLVQIGELLDTVKVDDDWATKCLSKAKVDQWSDMPSATIAKCIEHLVGKLGRNTDRKPAMAGAGA
jgi:GTPase SAR1 family protein